MPKVRNAARATENPKSPAQDPPKADKPNGEPRGDVEFFAQIQELTPEQWACALVPEGVRRQEVVGFLQ